jgi:hypothetical protein
LFVVANEVLFVPLRAMLEIVRDPVPELFRLMV